MIKLKYPHTNCFISIQFCWHKWLTRCIEIPYRHPALHPCLPLHPPALQCLQALCPAHPPHHYLHTKLEYIPKFREKKNIYTVKRATLNWNHSEHIHLLLSEQEILKCVSWKDIIWNYTSKLQERKECLSLGICKAFAVKAAGLFWEEGLLKKFNKKGTERPPNQN